MVEVAKNDTSSMLPLEEDVEPETMISGHCPHCAKEGRTTRFIFDVYMPSANTPTQGTTIYTVGSMVPPQRCGPAFVGVCSSCCRSIRVVIKKIEPDSEELRKWDEMREVHKKYRFFSKEHPMPRSYYEINHFC